VPHQVVGVEIVSGQVADCLHLSLNLHELQAPLRFELSEKPRRDGPGLARSLDHQA
jgi:hypothetical protein